MDEHFQAEKQLKEQSKVVSDQEEKDDEKLDLDYSIDSLFEDDDEPAVESKEPEADVQFDAAFSQKYVDTAQSDSQMKNIMLLIQNGVSFADAMSMTFE